MQVEALVEGIFHFPYHIFHLPLNRFQWQMKNVIWKMENAFLSINSESIPQQQGQQVVYHRRIDRQVAVLFASEDCVGGRMLHQSCDSGFRRIDVEGESEEALARNAAVAGDE